MGYHLVVLQHYFDMLIQCNAGVVPLEKPEERTFMKKLCGNLILVARFLLFPEYTPSMATMKFRAACALQWRIEQIGV